MNGVAASIGVTLGAIVLIFFVAILSTFIGMITGWVVGLFFTPSLTSVMVAIGMTPVPIWQFGAFLGFVGSFFRSTATKAK